MYSIAFGDKNTFVDWGLIPTAPILFSPPAVKEKVINMPGINGQLNLTGVYGKTAFEPRKGTIEFYCPDAHDTWLQIYEDIMNTIHGRINNIAVLTEDPTWYYEGLFTVSSWVSEEHYSKVVFDYVLNPYKKDIKSTDDEWIWDDFNFETDYAITYKNIHIDIEHPLTILLPKSPLEAHPAFECSDNMILEIDDKMYPLKKGFSIVPAVSVGPEKDVTMVIKGTGSVTVMYRRNSF